jgi:regulator of cell morphogenesis and NO signaling
VLTHNHEEVETFLSQIRDLTRNFTPPLGICLSYKKFYSGLHTLEHDLLEHIYLETDILFPRSMELEASASVAVA